MQVADINDDGNNDILFSDAVHNTFAYKGDGQGGLELLSVLKRTPYQYSSTFFDYDHDGDLDIFGSNFGEAIDSARVGKFFFHKNNGTPSSPAFGNAEMIIDDETDEQLVVKGMNIFSTAYDFNRDGNVDLVVPARGKFYYYEGTGDLSFINKEVILEKSGYPTPVLQCTFGDLNNDGAVDMVFVEKNYLTAAGAVYIKWGISP